MAQAAADAWTAAMMSLWSAGLFVLKLVLSFADTFLTPDLSEDGPGRHVYVYSFWIAASLVIVMAMLQLGLAAVRREGRSLARVAIGAAQFVMVWSCWLAYCVAVLAACNGVTKALMQALLGVDGWAEWNPAGTTGVHQVTDTVGATVLGLLGCVLWIAALGHLLVMLARAASLIVLVATGPIAAAGLVSEAGRSWFWKGLRWFHAAALTPVIIVLVLGIGVQLSTGVAAGLGDGVQKSIGTALPAVMLICISAVAPMALFKLLAFVDPGTPSGASFRQGMAMQGGLQGLLGGGGQSATGGGSTTASQADDHGRSSGEAGAETSTTDRFTSSAATGLGSLGGMRWAADRGWDRAGAGSRDRCSAEGRRRRCLPGGRPEQPGRRGSPHLRPRLQQPAHLAGRPLQQPAPRHPHGRGDAGTKSNPANPARPDARPAHRAPRVRGGAGGAGSGGRRAGPVAV